MRIVDPSFTITAMTQGDPLALMQHIESCGRECYQSKDRMDATSYYKFIRDLVRRGHESVLEHGTVSALIVCDRGVSHELVRHRIASYSQESTRYCNYSKDKSIAFVVPKGIQENVARYKIWLGACKFSEQMYMELIDMGCPPQDARSVLAHSLKTSVSTTMNMRSWRNFFKQRLAKNAHPDMRDVAEMGFKAMYKNFKPIFYDIAEEYGYAEKIS